MPARSRASRATRRASWSGTGVRAASLDAARTVCAAVSGVVRQPACATTGRAPARVQTQYPTHRPSSTRGVRAPRRASGSGPSATSGCWVTPTVGMPVTAPRWTASPAATRVVDAHRVDEQHVGCDVDRVERGDRGGERRTLPTPRAARACTRPAHVARRRPGRRRRRRGAARPHAWRHEDGGRCSAARRVTVRRRAARRPPPRRGRPAGPARPRHVRTPRSNRRRARSSGATTGRTPPRCRPPRRAAPAARRARRRSTARRGGRVPPDP